MKVLVTGGNGQLGKCIKSELMENFPVWLDWADFYFTDVNDPEMDCLDITNKNDIDKYISDNGIDVIINCAAYTNVDRAENVDEYEKVNAINVVGVRNLAEICDERDVFLINISTDFVFDGRANKPYSEDEICNPINVYGRTKYFGENETFWCKNHMIIRTAWLYSEYGKNFFKTMLNRINDGIDTKVVSDQVGTPTYARDLARFILHILEKDNINDHIGTYHFTNLGVCSWYDLASTIEFLKTGDCKYIKPCKTEDYKCDADRPTYSVLGKDKLNGFNFKNRHWILALKECISRYK
jgi:dTDP-4-dehydrorhamnose reductase